MGISPAFVPKNPGRDLNKGFASTAPRLKARSVEYMSAAWAPTLRSCRAMLVLSQNLCSVGLTPRSSALGASAAQRRAVETFITTNRPTNNRTANIVLLEYCLFIALPVRLAGPQNLVGSCHGPEPIRSELSLFAFRQLTPRPRGRRRPRAHFRVK